MKKLFVVALAAIGMVSCVNEDVVSVKGGDAIAFDNAFIDNATRAAADPSTTTASLDAFDVWAFMDSVDGTVFEGENVTKSGVDWTYVNTQYWLPNHTYYFSALAPMDSANATVTPSTDVVASKLGLGKVVFTNVDGSEDLVYAKKSVTTAADINIQPEAVKLQFQHLLSKVKFTFENGFTNDNAELVVKNITMTAPAAGTIDLAVADYSKGWVLSGGANYAFGDVARLGRGDAGECANERLTIPASADYVYNVTFTVDLYMGGVLAETFDETTTVTGVALEMGKAYNFKATLYAQNLGLFPITFEVEKVEDWVDAGASVTVLDDVVVNGGTLTLVADGEATSTIEVSNGGTLDGAGHTLSADPTEVQNNGADFLKAGNLTYLELNGGATVNNVTIDGQNATYDNGIKTYGIRGIVIASAGTYNLDNVTVVNVTYPVHVRTTEVVTLNVQNSTLEGWTSYNPATTANFTNVKFTKGTYGNFRPYGDTVLFNCDFTDVTIDLGSLAVGKTIRIIDCTYNGAPVTAANVAAWGVDVDFAQVSFN